MKQDCSHWFQEGLILNLAIFLKKNRPWENTLQSLLTGEMWGSFTIW